MWGHAQRGAVAVSFLLVFAMLIGFMGLALDMGRLFVSKSELQNAADACALAASSALTGANSNQLQVAENYGATAAARNRVGMQAVSASVPLNSSVTFGTSLTGTFLPRSAIGASAALSIRYVRCSLMESNIPTLVLRMSSMLGENLKVNTVQASATASLEPSAAACAIPLALCKKTGTSAPDFGYTVGEWFSGRFSPQSGVAGKFKWVEFQGYSRTKDLATLLAKGGQCDLSAPSLGLMTGVISSLIDGWNWRFGVKKNSGAPAGAYPPDLTGYAYTSTNWAAQKNAYSDFISRRGTNTPWNSLPSLGGSWSASTSAVHAAGGDRRMVVMPIMDCSGWDSGGLTVQPTLGWACALMLNPVGTPNDTMAMEYRGSSLSSTWNCVSSGAPGGPGATGPRVPTLVM